MTAHVSRPMLLAGALQLASALAPAAAVRLAPDVAFHRVPTAGAALLVLGMATFIVAVLPRGWWRWLPGTLTMLVLAVLYWRLLHAPSATFIDPLLRHAVEPAWGFVPMAAAALLSLAGAAMAPGRGGEGSRASDLR